jgi:GNAT superfamily N-acetyltransferase
MPFDPETLSLRAAAAGDEEFLFSLYASSRDDDLRELQWDDDRISEFLRMQYEAQQRFIKSEYQVADDQVVLMNGAGIGRILVERRDHEIRGVDIALLPEFRNQGIGSWLIAQLQSEASRAHKPLRIQVIRFSRAISLLERLGFARTSETGTHYQMEWTADS